MQEPVPDFVPPATPASTYISRPSSITALQWTGENLEDVKVWVGNDNLDHWVSGTALTLWVEANTSWLPLETGEWIIKDDLGFYPCKDSMFQRKYERDQVVADYLDNHEAQAAVEQALANPQDARPRDRKGGSSIQLQRHEYAENSFELHHFTGKLLLSREDLEEAYRQLDDFLYPNPGYAPRISNWKGEDLG